MKRKLRFKRGDIIMPEGDLFDNCSLDTYQVYWVWTDSNLYALRHVEEESLHIQSFDSRWIDKNYELIGHAEIRI